MAACAATDIEDFGTSIVIYFVLDEVDFPNRARSEWELVVLCTIVGEKDLIPLLHRILAHRRRFMRHRA